MTQTTTREAILQGIRDKLRRIYGEDVGEGTYSALLEMLPNESPPFPDDLSIDQTDAIVICYGDHVQDGERPHLQVLQAFLKETVYPQVNAVHILPFYPWTSDDGFSVKDYTAVDPALGEWKHIDAMKDDFRLMFDAVFNHISAQSDWFQQFLQGKEPYKDFFITVPPETDLSEVVRPRALPLLTPFETSEGTKHVWTTFSDDQVDLNFANPEVLLETLRILLLYVEHGAEFIRLDAIAFLWKEIGTSSIHLEQTHLIIQLMRDVLDLVAPQVVIITETNVPHKENISYFGDGSNEAQMVYQFPLPPLVLHTLTSGDSGYLTRWAQSLDPIGERTTYFNFTASHDGIGMRPVTGILEDSEVDALVSLAQDHGGNVSYKTNSDGSQSPYELNITYFDAITHPDITAQNPDLAVNRFMVSQAIQLSLAGVPGIYFGNLIGSRNWYEGLKQTGRFRTINRQKFDYNKLKNAIADSNSLTGKVFSRYMQLLNIRRELSAMHPLAQQEILDIGSSVFAVQRTSRDGESVVLALHNVTDSAVDVTLPAGEWRDLLGENTYSDSLSLDAYQICWLERQ